MLDSKLDILKIILKDKINIPLTQQEAKSLADVDPEIKMLIESLLDDSAYLEEVDELLKRIMCEARHESPEIREYVRIKCEEKHKELLFPGPKYKPKV